MKHILSTILLFSFILFPACFKMKVTESVPDGPMSAPTLGRNTATPTEGIRIGITVIPSATWTPTPVWSTKTLSPTWPPLLTNTPNEVFMALPYPLNLPILNGPPDGKCPTENPDFTPTLPNISIEGVIVIRYIDPLTEAFFDVLNQGASFTALRTALKQVSVSYMGGPFSFGFNGSELRSQDLTGDGVPEIEFLSRYRNLIYTCQSGKYQLVLDQFPFDPQIYMLEPITKDLNKDGLPEIIIGYDNYVDVTGSLAVSILEWRDNRFQSLITPEATRSEWDTLLERPLEGFYFVGGYAKVEIRDINSDGRDEIVIPSQQWNMDVLDHGPIRDETYYLAWNGEAFVPLRPRYSPPMYRFEAVEDGDRAFEGKDYNLALQFYRQAIEDPKLQWWSEDRYLQQLLGPDLVSTPIAPNSSEYPQLSAYAHFRIMLTYLAQGQKTYAQQAFHDLQTGFPENKLGHAYAELGKIFWETYQSTGSLSEGCDRANDFVEIHEEEIVGILDDSWHGWQSLVYNPKYPIGNMMLVCPFE